MKALQALGTGHRLSKADKRVLWAINLAVLAPITTAYPEDTDLPIVVVSMNDQISVTPSQVVAAKMQVELAEQLGESVSHLVRRIAQATPAVKASVGEVRS